MSPTRRSAINHGRPAEPASADTLSLQNRHFYPRTTSPHFSVTAAEPDPQQDSSLEGDTSSGAPPHPGQAAPRTTAV